MPLTKELEDALILIRELPEKDQQEAAGALRAIILHAEERATMTLDEQMRLIQLRAKERQKRMSATTKRIRKIAKDLGSL